MPRNSVGQYIPPTNSWSPSVNGVLATTADWQALLNDIVAALTQSVSVDGQSPLTGPLNAGNNPINNVTAGSGTGQALAFEQLFAQGTMQDLASAATTDIGLQNTNFLRITGNTTITSFGTNYRGPRFLVFAGAVTLTNSATLVLPGGANITTAAGDVLIAIPGATLGTADKWIVAAYQRKNGVYVDASGNVGIGTSSPSAKLDIAGNILFSAANPQIQFNGGGPIIRLPSANTLAFLTDDSTERMRIDSSGNLLVGTTSSTVGRMTVSGANVADAAWFINNHTVANHYTAISLQRKLNVGNFVQLWNQAGNAVIGSINTTDNSTVQYLTSSDYRLKENIAPMTGALSVVQQLKPCTYTWKESKVSGQGFIAHELQEAVPDAVSGEKDGVDPEGNPQYQGIDTSFLVATLAAAIQEQQQLITALTTRVAALETV